MTQQMDVPRPGSGSADRSMPWYPRGVEAIAYGADYNPEQWPESVWPRDVELMREAGVNLVSVGIFAWAELEPEPGRFTFEWLDRVIGLLYDGGIRVNLATPTAAPPAWLFRDDPTARPVTREGHRYGGGARQGFCPNSPAYASAAARITEAIGRRYGDHPALSMWHVHNEYGGVNNVCYCPTCAVTFRRMGRDRTAALRSDPGQPGPGTGLPALRQRRAPGELPAGAGHPAPVLPGGADHHQFHDREL